MNFFRNKLLRLIIALFILIVSIFIDDKFDRPNVFTYLAVISGIYIIIIFIICFVTKIIVSFNNKINRNK